MKTCGASIYLTGKELDAIESANSFLTDLLEKANPGVGMTELIETKIQLASLMEKAFAARRTNQRKLLVKAALKAAED